MATSGSSALQNILDNAASNDLYRYPTDFTRGIIPKAFHSHNDYWRDVPFYTALSHGAISIEADVYLVNNTALLVGHEPAALTPARTLTALYINPILDTLHRSNPPSSSSSSPPSRNGVYDTTSTQTLYLFIDLKTPGPETWPAVLSALAPLREADYLTTYDGETLRPGPITVVGTGNTPLALVQAPASAQSPRYAFYDAHLALLDTSESNVTRFEAPIASTAFTAAVGEARAGRLNETQRAVVRAQVEAAHARGILTRYWDLPGWPVGTRNAVWRELWDCGVDLVNADDLKAVAEEWVME
ncbi:hypothetical protein EJ05DRAFT_443132 [Pseudovirgaria hyperparasitica]|uniref:Altered inheritance of mitochondria protein 6 n=1 Tax=Pseudovirgaria hyperparasitica TaxID=470096 RepID=A0A6A6VYF8_9PEZI|nr:uncharacterized protein EJ05DRAFT_443132 [Pseudovirgaria hyperparasitica]KAF2754700.1 hypothetical protein EJ05DRAFT_443132 [Pseudovirgaria hyperparasitica]